MGQLELPSLVPALKNKAPIETLPPNHKGILRFKELEARAKRDYLCMRPYLPALESPAILDIGCGPAAIDLYLSWHYGHKAEMNLLDGTAEEVADNFAKNNVSKLDSYSAKNRPWKAATEGARVLAVNGITAKCWPADPSLTIPCDVIVSTFSWLHHYPAEIYLPLALRSLRPGGLIAVHVRNQTTGREVMEKHFQFVATAPGSTDDKKTMFTFFRRAAANSLGTAIGHTAALTKVDFQ